MKTQPGLPTVSLIGETLMKRVFAILGLSILAVLCLGGVVTHVAARLEEARDTLGQPQSSPWGHDTLPPPASDAPPRRFDPPSAAPPLANQRPFVTPPATTRPPEIAPDLLKALRKR